MNQESKGQSGGEEIQANLDIRRSAGQTKTGIPVFFVRPTIACDNRSHRFVGYNKKEKGIGKWFSPSVQSFLIDGHVIASNSEKNALREYHRVCAKEKIGQLFEVKTL